MLCRPTLMHPLTKLHPLTMLHPLTRRCSSSSRTQSGRSRGKVRHTTCYVLRTPADSLYGSAPHLATIEAQGALLATIEVQGTILLTTCPRGPPTTCHLPVLEAQGALLEFIAELCTAAEALAADSGVIELQPKQYAALVQDLDPTRMQEQTQQLVEWGFGVMAQGGELRDDLAIAPAAFVANLCRMGGAIEGSGGGRRLRSVLRVAKLAIGPVVVSAGAQPPEEAAEPAGAEPAR